MSKNVLKLFWVSLVLLTAACAARRIEAPTLEGVDFREALAARSSISAIETKFAIAFERNDTELRGDGALNISSAGDMSLRVYSLGFLAMELTSKEGAVKSNPRLDRTRTLILTKGLRDCLFWWDIKDFTVQEDAEYYLLRNSLRELWLDRKTLLQKRQKIYFDDGKELLIHYEEPAVENGVWYQSKIRIELLHYSVTLTVRNMSFKT